MAIYGYTKNYKLIKPRYDTDTWHDYEYDNLDTIDAVLSAIYASGDWQGFWKSNTHYNVGDIVIDRDTDTMYKVMVEHTTTKATFAAEWTAHHNYYELWSPNNLAESWATKTDGKVSDTDYSSKAYAISSGLINDGSAKEWAVKSGKIGNTNEYSAKKYATDAHNDYISMTTNPNVAAIGSNINNVNAVGQSISSVNKVASNVSSVNAVGNNISSVNTAAANIPAIKAAPAAASNATTSANNSHIWAEGTDAQVQALGGVHSSKGWAEQSTNANIALTNTPYTTNRILEIPQDIKLELNNGTLTLKAGSTYYKCDGNFTKTTTSQDYSITNVSNGYRLVFFTGNGFDIPSAQDCNSGTSEPTTGNKWFNVSNNILYSGSSGNWQQRTNYSLPLAIITVSDGTITSIDQVFNGFGYIGSTVFALPGVKVQIPNGKNEDGTYKSFIYTVSSVLTQNYFNNGTTNGKAVIVPDTKNVLQRESTNLQFDSNTGYMSRDIRRKSCIIANVSWTTSGINSFKPYSVDSVVNSNEFYQLKDKTVTTDTNQTISGSKRFTQPSGGMSIELVADTNQQINPASDTSTFLGIYRNKTHTKGDGYTSWIHAMRGANGVTRNTLYVRKFLEGDSQEITNYVSAEVLPDGTPVAYTRTPPAGSGGNEIVTAAWFNSKMQVVRTVIETYRNGANWYRIWSDGWIEQGGVAAFTGSGQSVSLMKAMSNANYTLNFAGKAYEDTSPGFGYVNKTTTAFTVKYYLRVTAQVYLDWSACGY